MSFVNPLLLLGALAALIPVAIHLFDRRKAKPHPFAAISFVLRSQKRTARRLKLKRLILYSLRTLLLLAIPIALARPLFRKQVAATAAKGPAATALVLDGSLAMRWKDGATLFENARKDAREALSALSADEPATVFVCGVDSAPSPPRFDRAALREKIDRARPGYGNVSLNGCLQAAAQALEKSPLPAKRIELFSALTQGELNLGDPPPTVAGPNGKRIRPELRVHDAARGKKVLPNRAIVGLEISPAPRVGPRSYQLAVTVRNWAPKPVRDLEASLELSGRVVAKGFFDLPADGAARKILTYAFDQGGPVRGVVRIAGDGLAADDARAFTLQVPRALRALVVDGAPSAVRWKDAAFFLKAALDAPGSPVEATVLDPGSAFREKLSDYDLIFLLDVPAPTSQQADALDRFVKNGGGLFIAMGDQVNPDDYDARLGALLPRPLRLVKTASSPDDPNVDQKAARLARADTHHPIFEPFIGRAREGLFSARFFRYMLLEPTPSDAKSASRVLATYDDGAPAMAISRHGKGRVLLFTSSLDHTWTDLPIRTSYLPLIQRCASFLSGALDEKPTLHPRVGNSVTLAPSDREHPRAVRSPDGRELPVGAPGARLRVGPLPEPGLYLPVDASGKPLDDLAFAATLDPAASDLTRVKPDALSAYFGQDAIRGPKGAAQHEVPIWTWLIALGVVAFFLEGTLLRRS